MSGFIPRKLKFKAWNSDTGLLVRLDSIACVRGELVKENHIILQYTGHNDKHGEELYEMDVILTASGRRIIRWCGERGCWCFGEESAVAGNDILTREAASAMVRLCSCFESSGEPN